MSNTLLQFQDKYYEYRGNVEPDQRGCTIGGYESAWLTDLVMNYILDKEEEKAMKSQKFFKTYRDDGLSIFNGKMDVKDLENWLKEFQGRVNKLLKSEALQFTAEIWMGDGEIGRATKVSGVKVVSKNAFPYLDIEMFWNNQDLHFKVYKKNNQQLKCLN